MRKLMLVTLAGCWTGSAKPADPPKPNPSRTADSEYGGATYGGATYAAGLLGATTLQQGGAFASLTGTGDISSGFDDPDFDGGLTGSGSGVSGVGTIGTGGRGVGTLRGGIRPPSSTVPRVSLGQPTADAGLDKAIIRRYIKRNIQKIQYCYEKELLANPSLTGTVRMKFTIGVDGIVTSSSGSGMAPVDGCVATVIRGIEFPKPAGGGAVTVVYPFTFQPA